MTGNQAEPFDIAGACGLWSSAAVDSRPIPHAREAAMPVMQPDEYGYHQAIKTFASEAEPAFESPEMQRLVWGREWGCPNDVGTLRVVLLHRPGDELKIVDTSK